MKKIAIFSSLLLLVSSVASAAVTVDVQPVSLVTSPVVVAASSSPIGLIKFSLTGSASETLSSVKVTLNAVAGSSVSSSDIDKLAVYKDANGNGTFEAGTDDSAGSVSLVNVGSSTTVNTTSHNDLSPTATFFVTLETASSWSNVNSPVDAVTASIAADGIVTSADSPTVSTVTTAAVTAGTADHTGPDLSTAVASKSGSTKKVVLTFDEATNKPTINDSNINTLLHLNNSHSWLDGADNIGSASWNSGGTALTVTLSSGTSNPTVVVGDTVTVSGATIKDLSDNNASGDATITGNFTGSGDNEGDNEGDDEGEGHACTNTLMNGHLYKVAGDANTTVYLAAHCILKPFRGAAVFHARGHKFQNIIILNSLTGFTVSDKPALPADGTLVKGSNTTVWFIEKGGKRKGFASAAAFLGLGFHFDQVNQISDSDLNTMSEDNDPIKDAKHHPDGALIKCTTSPTVGQVEGSTIVPFANADSFELRGHTFTQVATINCEVFHYTSTTPITN